VPEVETRLHAMTLAARSAGLTLDVITTRDIHDLCNLQILEAVYDRGGRRYRAEEVREPILDLMQLMSHKAPTVGTLRSLLQEHALPSGYLEAAIFHRVLAVRNGQTFGPDASIGIWQARKARSGTTHFTIPEQVMSSLGRCPDELVGNPGELTAVADGVLAAARSGHDAGGRDD